MEEVLQDSCEADTDCDKGILFEKYVAEQEALEKKFGPIPIDVLMEMVPSRHDHGRVLPKDFKHLSATPQSLFPVGISRQAIPHITRFIHRDDPGTLLIYISGASLTDGLDGLQGGWARVLGPLAPNIHSSVSDRLKHKGLMGDTYWQTRDRADLRAVIGTLRFRHWRRERLTRLVLGTNSEHAVEGGEDWARSWAEGEAMGVHLRTKTCGRFFGELE